MVLVSARSGDVEPLTLKGLQQNSASRWRWSDHLVSDDIMDLVRRDTDRGLSISKRARYHVPREEINLNPAAGKRKRQTRVVRLKVAIRLFFWPWWRRARPVQRGYSVLRVVQAVPLRLLCLFGYSTHASRLCPPERTLNYGRQNRWRAVDWENFGGGRKTDAGVLYGVGQAATIQQS